MPLLSAFPRVVGTPGQRWSNWGLCWDFSIDVGALIYDDPTRGKCEDFAPLQRKQIDKKMTQGTSKGVLHG